MGETNFREREIPRRGSKAKDEEKKKRKNNGQLRFCPPPRVEHASRLDQNRNFEALPVYININFQFKYKDTKYKYGRSLCVLTGVQFANKVLTWYFVIGQGVYLAIVNTDFRSFFFLFLLFMGSSWSRLLACKHSWPLLTLTSALLLSTLIIWPNWNWKLSKIIKYITPYIVQWSCQEGWNRNLSNITFAINISCQSLSIWIAHFDPASKCTNIERLGPRPDTNTKHKSKW